MIKHFIRGIILFLLVNLALSIIPATIDRNNIQVGQTFTLNIDVSNTNGTPEIDTLRNNFDILGTSNNSQMSIINGNMNSQKSIMVTLSPKKPGKQQIPAINSNAKVFIDVSLDNSNTYINVPVIYNLKLYFTVSLNNLSMANLDIPDAQIKPLGKNIQYRSSYRGKEYEVIEQKLLITPNKAGSTNIPPARISGLIMDRDPNNLFASLSNFNVQSKPLTINVLPAPDKNPQTLLAKKLHITDSWSVGSESIAIGQPVTRTITIEATGIPYNLIPELKPNTPKGINSYPDKTLTDTSIIDDKLVGQKTFKIVYIPTSSGIIKFPETKIKWWDINKKVEKTEVLEAKTYNVLADPKKTIASSAPITTPKILKPNKTTIPWWIYLGLIITSIVAILIILIKKKLIPHKKQHSYRLIKKAVKDKNINALNHALISWASTYINKNIYTISDIKELINNKNIHELIDKLNLSLYKGYPFNEFDLLLKEINTILHESRAKNKEFLKKLYPE